MLEIIAGVFVLIFAIYVAVAVNAAGGYPPYQDSTKCNQDCSQGRACTCIDQTKLRLDDEFNNANWPFPVNKP